MVEPPRDPLSTGSTAPEATELAPEEEPVVIGTLFLSMLLLIGVAGAWIVIYWMLLNR
ncbi:MAG TPA: hypothetical protein VK864_10275 [Longimicrobiales bacterium]|nr:hypothetical protein [Longimicrobiales bacterium]